MTTTNLPEADLPETRYWWRHLNRAHWYVLILCALGWLFDCADQMIFTSSRSIAMRDLLPGTTAAYQTWIGGWATTLFMIGWASGGLVFGIIGDKWGRAKTMTLTVFLYAVFTGLSALSHNWVQFAVSRFITGFGVGGEFAAGAALVADVMPQQARAQALGLLQALSALGNILGAAMLQVVTWLAGNNEHQAWRELYLIGTAPALVAVFVMSRMKEPDKWVRAKAAAKESGARNFGRIADLFTDRVWRRNTIVGLALAISGVVGLWGIGFYSPELIDATFPQMTSAAAAQVRTIVDLRSDAARSTALASLERAAAGTGPQAAVAHEAEDAYGRLLARTVSYGETLPKNPAEVRLSSERRARIAELMDRQIEPKEAARLKSHALIVQQVGAFFGMLMFSILAVRIGRRWTFALSFVLAWISIFIVFLSFHSERQIWYLYPLLGFCTLLPFGGYAVYFPELFPTRLRTTGTGFCYNVGRYVSSLGPLVFGGLGTLLTGRFEIPAFRLAAVIVASIYIVGIIAAFAGPETKDQPLPEDAILVH